MISKLNVFIAGHNGMVGRAILKEVESLGNRNIITVDRADLDLCNQSAVSKFFNENKIDEVYLAAAKVGGIKANSTYPADFIYENITIQTNIIHSSYVSGVNKLLFLGSSCIYPKLAVQPMREDMLMTGPLEETNEPYAVAKIAGIKLCESYNRQYSCDYRSVMPTNLYGPYDNFHRENSHVLPALLRRFHEAGLNEEAAVEIWGSGEPLREFLHVNDMASACVHVMELPRSKYDEITQPMLSHINVGTGRDCSIRDLAEIIAGITGYEGRLVFDNTKLDGTKQKLLDVSRLDRLGWQAKIGLKEGIKDTYLWYVKNFGVARM